MSLDNLSPELLFYSKTRHPEPSKHFGIRFNEAGVFLPEPGNTIICHVSKGSHTQQVLMDARERFLSMPEAGQFLFTPVSSLHMTLFQGIIEHRRGKAYWPADVDLGTPIDEMTAIMRERLMHFSMSDPFKIEVIGARPSGLLVEGASEADRKTMRAWRNAFADLLGYRHPDHDVYPFHITFSYVMERLEDEALPRWQQMLDAVAADIRERAPVIEVDLPAFCTFADMNHFEEILVFDFKS